MARCRASLRRVRKAWTVISPSIYTGLVTTPDFLRLALDLCLLVGIEAEMASNLDDLRAENSDLERLRKVEVQRAALEERAHLSRELHDGLAQNLWLAKLKAGRLTSVDELPAEAAVLADELGTAIDDGLAEAQQAVTALRVAGEPEGPIWEVITRYVEDFSDRFGMRAEIDCPTGSSELETRAEAELVRIAQEALSNISRHADATFVRVGGAVANGRLQLFVGDNGCGFDPTAHADSGYGLTSMRERAIRIGGSSSLTRVRRTGRASGSLYRCRQAGPSHGSRAEQTNSCDGGGRNALVRAAVRQALIAPDIEIVAEASTAEEALEAAPRTHPEVLLLDIDLPGMDGVSLVRELAPRLPATRIVMLTVSSADQHVLEATRLGASDT